MIFPDVKQSIWCKRHNLRVKQIACPKCGKKQRASIPFITQKIVGLIAPLHECGPGFQLSTGRPRDKSEQKQLTIIYEAVSEYLKGGVNE